MHLYFDRHIVHENHLPRMSVMWSYFLNLFMYFPETMGKVSTRHPMQFQDLKELVLYLYLFVLFNF